MIEEQIKSKVSSFIKEHGSGCIETIDRDGYRLKACPHVFDLCVRRDDIEQFLRSFSEEVRDEAIENVAQHFDKYNHGSGALTANTIRSLKTKKQ